MLPPMLRALYPWLLLSALLGACSDEAAEGDICSNENVVDDIDDAAPAAANGG